MITFQSARLSLPGQLLSSRQPDRREKLRSPLKKNGWMSQRFKPFLVEFPRVIVKRGKKRDTPKKRIILTFDDLPKIRDEASTIRNLV